MSPKLFGLAVLSIVLCTSMPIHAGVLRAEKLVEAPSSDPQLKTSELPMESTTLGAILTNPTTQSRDEDSTTRHAIASLDPAPGTIDGIEITLDTVEDNGGKPKQSGEGEKPSADDRQREEERMTNDEPNENEGGSALSRDEAASIQVHAHESDDLARETTRISAESAPYPQKHSKLLLLSTPRLAREQEENISEPEGIDINTAVSTDETTELSIEVETETEMFSDDSEEDKKEGATDEPSFISRVRDVIFGKKSEGEATKETEIPDNKRQEQKPSAEVEKQDKESKRDEDDVISAAVEQAPELHNDNAAKAVLIEAEADYVLVDSDVEYLDHLGSFTHADSDEHLQPIVHSVEVVPSHFDEPLLLADSYVHVW